METTDSGREQTGPASSHRGPARAGLLGALVGAGALVGGLLVATGGAGAQPATLDDPAAPAQADAAEVVDGDEYHGEYDADFEAYDACIEGVLADNGIAIDIDDVEDEPELSDAQWEAIDADITECEAVLPAELVAEWAELDEAFAEYEACLVDHDLVEEFDEDGEYDVGDGETIAFILIEDDDGATAIEFGDGDGSVDLTKVDGEITFSTDGDVDVQTLDWEELEAEHGEAEMEYLDDEAFEVCDELLDDLDLFEDDEYLEDEYLEDGDVDEAEDAEADED